MSDCTYVWLPDDEAAQLLDQWWRDLIDEVTAELARRDEEDA